MIVYFARSIRGKRSVANNYYYLIPSYILESGNDLASSKGLPKEIQDIKETDEFIFKRDTYWLDQSECIIADVSNPSLGVGFEIAYGFYERKIPIIPIAYKGSKVSAMISGLFNIDYYDSELSLEMIIEKNLLKVEGLI